MIRAPYRDQTDARLRGATPRQARLREATPRQAFTLIEMVVVVAIIGLLLAIAVPVSTGLVKSSQEKATLATLETVKTAIEVFANEKPLRFLQYQFEPDGGAAWGLFGPLPPSPTALLSLKTGPAPGLVLSAPETDPKPDKTARVVDERTQDKFTGAGGIIEGYLQSVYYPPGKTDQAHRYPTSECLLVFLRTYSPQAKAITDKIGKYLTNEDADRILRVNPATGTPYSPPQAEDLLELRDAWGNPVRYTVIRIGPVVGGVLYRWELRSAGRDSKFADVDVWPTPRDGIPDPFSAEAAANPGDDVIVSGSIKVEN